MHVCSGMRRTLTWSELAGFQLKGLDLLLQGAQVEVWREGQAAVATLIGVSQVGLKLAERGVVGSKGRLWGDKGGRWRPGQMA